MYIHTHTYTYAHSLISLSLPPSLSLSPPLQGVSVCVICREEAEDPIASACRHVFCREEAALYVSSCTGRAQCPSCFRPLTIDLTQPTMAAGCVLCMWLMDPHMLVYLVLFFLSCVIPLFN